jgi:hypothetical protein
MQMKRIIVIAGLLFAAGCANADPDLSTRKPGDVLSEHVEKLPGGFRLVQRSIVNPAGHWEGIGHFAFLYFRGKKLCQCGGGDVSISPTAKYALFQDGPTGKLRLINTTTGRIDDVATKYVGSPKKFSWNEAAGVVVVAFYQNLNNGYPDVGPLSVSLRQRRASASSIGRQQR